MKGHYTVTYNDVISALSYREREISPQELKARLKQCASVHELQKQGFVISLKFLSPLNEL